jgi:hypothetical protein
MLIIPAGQEAVVSRISLGGQSWQKVRKVAILLYHA